MDCVFRVPAARVPGQLACSLRSVSGVGSRQRGRSRRRLVPLGQALYATSLCLHSGASPGGGTPRQLHHLASLPRAQRYLQKVAAEGASCVRAGAWRPPSPGVAPTGSPPCTPESSGTCCGPAAGDWAQASSPRGWKASLVSEPRGFFVFLPTKGLVAETVVFIHHLSLPHL